MWALPFFAATKASGSTSTRKQLSVPPKPIQAHPTPIFQSLEGPKEHDYI